MPRTHLCIVCAALTAAFAMLLLIAPSPALSQDGDEAERATSVHVGDEADNKGTVHATLKMVGTERVLSEFKLLVLAGMDDGENAKHTAFTDENGRLAITLGELPKTLRIFAYGDYTIPESWSNVPVGSMKFEDTETWDLYVRPLRRITISGRVSVQGRDAPAGRANVAFAPLDVGQDGSVRLFDEPMSVLTDDDGDYRVELPTGYYKVWSYWADRSTAEWTGYIRVADRREFFNDQELNLTLQKGPQLEGRVIDARTGEGVAASINLYSNQYLRQLRNYTADGRFPDEEVDGEEVFWPVGTFKFQAWMIDPADFTVVIRPANTESVLRVIPDLDLESLGDGDITFELFTEDMRAVDLKVTTHEHDFPINEIDVNLVPRLIDVPQHLAQSYEASGMTDNNGVASFRGLATGSYEVYAWRSSMFLGEITVSEADEQEVSVHLEIPFVYGQVKRPGGEVCKDLMVFVWITNKAGDEFGPFSSDAFKDNPVLRKDGRVFVPVLSEGSTFRLKFAAFEEGTDLEDAEWESIDDFPLVTEEFKLKVEEEKGWKIDLELKDNPNYKTED